MKSFLNKDEILKLGRFENVLSVYPLFHLFYYIQINNIYYTYLYIYIFPKPSER